MAIELDIPNANLLNLEVDENAQSDVFKAILAKDINVCISRVNADLVVRRDDPDVDFYLSMLRLIRRVSEVEGLEFVEPSGLAAKPSSIMH